MNGMGGSGKDTFVEMLNEFVPTLHISIVDKVKEIARSIGWDGSKTEKDRKFLFDLKTVLDNYNDCNYTYIREKVEAFNSGELGDYDVLCMDLREKHQIERAKKDFGAKAVLVIRDSAEFISSNDADANVFSIDYDIIINNSGTLDELRDEAKKFAVKYVLV